MACALVAAGTPALRHCFHSSFLGSASGVPFSSHLYSCPLFRDKWTNLLLFPFTWGAIRSFKLARFANLSLHSQVVMAQYYRFVNTNGLAMALDPDDPPFLKIRAPEPTNEFQHWRLVPADPQGQGRRLENRRREDEFVVEAPQDQLSIDNGNAGINWFVEFIDKIGNFPVRVRFHSAVGMPNDRLIGGRITLMLEPLAGTDADRREQTWHVYPV